MQVGASCSTCLTDTADDIALFDDIACFDGNFTHMGIQANNSLTVVDENHVSTEEEVTRFDNNAIGGCFYWCAFFRSYIETIVRIALLFVKKTS